MMIRAGCFFGTRPQFELQLISEHKDNEHGREYRAALAYFDAHFAVWPPEAPAADMKIDGFESV